MNRVINFHDVSDIKWFETTILLLKRIYRIISPAEITEYYYGDLKLKNGCLITIDDGDETFYKVIYPVLKKHNVPAILFVSPLATKREEFSNFWFQEIRNCDRAKMIARAIETVDYVKDTKDYSNHFFSQMQIDDIWKLIHWVKKEDNTPYFPPQNMNVEQLKEVDREGIVTIGAHTMWHPFLAAETNERSKWEIERSVSDLSDLLGHTIQFFAYPNGRPQLDFGEREMGLLGQTSVKLAFTTEHRNFKHNDNKYAIPRYGLSSGSETFIRIKLGLGRRYNDIKRIASIFK